MKRSAVVSLAAFVLSGAAWAQSIGAAAKVEGLVTVSDGQTLTNLQPGQPIPDGSTIITGTGSSATLQLQVQGGSCTLEIGPGRQVQVLAGSTCQQLNVAIVASAAALPGGSGGLGSFLTGSAGSAGAVGAAAAAAAGVAAVGLVARSKLSTE